MKTTNCILRDGPARTAGGAGPRVLSANENKVVDLAAWKSEHLMIPDEPETGRAGAPRRYEGREPVRRRRRRRTAVQNWAELTATLAVTAVLLALVARVLLF